MRTLLVALLLVFVFASFALTSNPSAAPSASEMNNDAAVAAVVTFLAGAGLWFVVLGVGAAGER